ncbi:helix-turn-helix transcriptional regulator [Enterococcus massiliensis]|uniref:helix-turn-helix transcriptional regulator n=1 Tax=Enterococcus massiliensis TaxID=1640685 RepID=UPI00065DCDD5|nr:helix-turn-helix transcriptional regulator [Enterococcus massiliensis]
MELNQQLKKLRIEHQLTQEELAKKILVSRQTVSNWENGKAQPDLQNLLILSNLYQVSIDEMLENKSEPTLIKTYPLAKRYMYGLIVFSVILLILQIILRPRGLNILLFYTVGGLIGTGVYMWQTKRAAALYSQTENMYDIGRWIWITFFVGIFLTVILQSLIVN